jgi:hypothetical protein
VTYAAWAPGVSKLLGALMRDEAGRVLLETRGCRTSTLPDALPGNV